MQHKAAKQCGKRRGKHNACGGQQKSLKRYRFCRAPLSAEPAVKHNKNQRYSTQFFGKRIIVKIDFKNPVRTEHHTQ